MVIKGQLSYKGQEKVIEGTLMCDFYKIAHREGYAKGTEIISSLFIPRNNKYLKNAERVVVFGIQYFVKKYLVEYFNENFFARDKEAVVKEYKRYIKNTLFIENPETKHIEDLHDLGYLPIKLSAIKEGLSIPYQVPVLAIENTDKRFFWLTNYLETLLSTELWLPITSATQGKTIRNIFNKYALETVGNTESADFQAHDFSMRGMQSLEAGMVSGAGHLLANNGTDTITAIMFLEKYYNADVEKELVGSSIPACYDSKTEILTENGWKLFKDLKKNEKVAQYHENGNIDFVVPSNYYNMSYKGDMVRFSNKEGKKDSTVDILVTPNHRMIRRRRSNLELQIVEAGDTSYHNHKVYGSKNYLIISGKSVGKFKHLSALDKLKIAFQADGSFYSDDEKRNGNRSGEFSIRFSFKKERKIKRLQNILEELNYNYSMYEKDKRGYVTFHVKTPVRLQKDFSWVNLNDKSFKWCREFIKELSQWDGNSTGTNGIMYSNTDINSINMVQAISSIAGCKSRINQYVDKRTDSNRKTIYYINILEDKELIGGNVVEKNTVYYEGTVHCVSVPTKMLVVRRNGAVVISGNTEHSVMCSLTPPDGERDEYEAFKYLITEVYPEGFVSIVSDTYDFWRVIGETLPRLKNEIMSRNGRVVIRPDSGNPVQILCGNHYEDLTYDKYTKTLEDAKDYFYDLVREDKRAECGDGFCGDDEIDFEFKYEGRYYRVKYEVEYNRHDKRYYYVDGIKYKGMEEIFPSVSDLGLIESLWNTFGGTISEKGYKVLDSHIGAIYGDSMTYDRVTEICKRLKAKGFASTNFVAGLGSYFYGGMVTRDSLGLAMKATYCEVNGEGRLLMKDPKTDSGKRSLKGRVFVYENEEGEIICKDNLYNKDIEELSKQYDNMLEVVFENGFIKREETFSEIRSRVRS